MTLARGSNGGAAPWTRLAFLVAVAAVVAGLTHLVTILTLPYRSPEDAYARVGALAAGATPDTVPVPPGLLAYQDPALATAACLYDLRAGQAHVALDVGGADFAVLAVYGRHGKVLYGLTSRSATHDRLGLTILTAAQAAADPATGTTPADIRVVAEEPAGLVLAQVLAVAPSAMPAAEARARGLACTDGRSASPPK